MTSRFVKFDISLTNDDSYFVINKLLKDDVSKYINRNLINYYFSPGNIYKLINFSIENSGPSSDKISLIRMLVREGIQNFNVDSFFASIQAHTRITR